VTVKVNGRARVIPFLFCQPTSSLSWKVFFLETSCRMRLSLSQFTGLFLTFSCVFVSHFLFIPAIWCLYRIKSLHHFSCLCALRISKQCGNPREVVYTALILPLHSHSNTHSLPYSFTPPSSLYLLVSGNGSFGPGPLDPSTLKPPPIINKIRKRAERKRKKKQKKQKKKGKEKKNPKRRERKSHLRTRLSLSITVYSTTIPTPPLPSRLPLSISCSSYHTP